MSQRFSSQLKAVVFDLDGTLLDTAPEFVVVVQTLRAEHDLPPLPAEQINACVSDGARAMCSLALDMPQDHPEFEARRQRFLDIYAADLGSNTQPYEGIVELLALLSQAGIAWGISTNKPSYLTNPLLETLDLEPPPLSVVCPDHVSQPKPHPEPLLLNASQLGCNAAEVVYIGDHRRDIDAGRAAGMYTIAAAYGYIHEKDSPANWGANSIAGHSLELSGLIADALN